MTFQQLKAILYLIDATHRQIGISCDVHVLDRPPSDGSGEYERLLAIEIQLDQVRMRKTLRDLLDSRVERQPLPIWIQYVPTQPLDAEIAALAEPNQRTLAELIGQIQSVYRQIIQLTERVREQTESDVAHRLLGDLAQREAELSKSLSNRFQGMDDA